MAKWEYVVEGWGSVFTIDADEFVKRDRLVELLRASEWYAAQEEGGNSELARQISAFEDCEDVMALDGILAKIYDLADDQRAWLDRDS